MTSFTIDCIYRWHVENSKKMFLSNKRCIEICKDLKIDEAMDSNIKLTKETMIRIRKRLKSNSFNHVILISNKNKARFLNSNGNFLNEKIPFLTRTSKTKKRNLNAKDLVHNYSPLTIIKAFTTVNHNLKSSKKLSFGIFNHILNNYLKKRIIRSKILSLIPKNL